MALSSQHREIIRRCQKSAIWFMRSFVKIKHPGAGIVPFEPFDYQQNAIRCFRQHRMNIFRKTRQCGISKVSGIFALWFAMFSPHKTILIVSRKDDDAMSFLAENIRLPFSHLPEWMKSVWRPIKDNEHEMMLPNGSRIKSLTSHPEVLRSNSSSLNIIDEAAFINDMDAMWAAGRPTLSHGGCLAGDSLLLTANGLVQIGDLHVSDDPWEDIDLDVPTDVGAGHASKSYYNGIVPTRRITTSDGHYIEASLQHRFRIVSQDGRYEWKYVKDITIGDQLVLTDKPRRTHHSTPLDTDLHNYRTAAPADKEWCVPEVIDNSLGTLLGVLYGGGFCDGTSALNSQACRDFISHLRKMATAPGDGDRHEITDDDWSVRFDNKLLWPLLLKNGLIGRSGDQITVPRPILASNSAVQASFLRGLFETSGSVAGRCVTLTSSSVILVRQVQSILLSLGMRSRIYTDRGKTGVSRYTLRLKTIRDMIRFRGTVGFISYKNNVVLAGIKKSRRSRDDRYANQAAMAELYDAANAIDRRTGAAVLSHTRNGAVSRPYVKSLVRRHPQLASTTLGTLARNNLFTDTVTDIDESVSRTYDITEDSCNTYVANGFVSHNSVIVISTCVAGDTYINTTNGLQQIKDFDGGFTRYDEGYHHKDYDGPDVFGNSGLQRPTAFYKRNREETRVITSKLGYELEAHTKHRLLICRDHKVEWCYADQVRTGDILPIKRGAMQFGDSDVMNFKDGPEKHHPTSFTVDKIDEELAEIVGLIVAEGYINDDYVTITSGDRPIHDFLLNNHWGLTWSPEERDTHIRCCNRRFVRFLRWLGCIPGLAPTKTIPRRLWSCSRHIVTAFLRRLFDGDGHSRARDGEVGYTSTSRELIKQVRMMLLNLGIICRVEHHRAYTKEFNLNNKHYTSECRESWQLIIRSGEAHKFYDAIGFGLSRKTVNATVTRRSREFVPNVRYWLRQLRARVGFSIGWLAQRGVCASSLLFKKVKRDLTERSVVAGLLSALSDYSDCEEYKQIESLADPSVYWDEVESISRSEAETYDFTIPGDHTFISNGMISHNTNGVGSWYWNTWTDAEAGANEFNPLMVNWWDMKWSIEYRDQLSGKMTRICPTDGIRPTAVGTYVNHPKYGKIELRPDVYGPFWSPWLEMQYRDLQEKGEAWKFDQEILAAFVGSGNTIMSKQVLVHVGTTVDDKFELVTGPQVYVHPVSGDEEIIDFTPNEPEEGLWIWSRPVTATPDKIMGGKMIEPGRKAHSYVAGVDIATGKGRDYHAIEIFDIDEMEQVAEAMFHCLPMIFKKMVDRICRWYNCALTVVERNNGGDIIIDDLNTEFNYPRLWRKSEFNGKTVNIGQYGFFTSQASKPALNKFLLDYIRDKTGEGFRIRSRRLWKQLQIYVRKRDKAGRDTGKTEAESGVGNHDDLVMATGLAMVGVPDSYVSDGSGIMPFAARELSSMPADMVRLMLKEKEFIAKGMVDVPMAFGGSNDVELSTQEELTRFMTQIGGLPTLIAMRERMSAVNHKKHQL